MIYGDIGRLEGDAVQTVGQTEDGIYAVLKAEIWLKFLISEVISAYTLFLIIVTEIPRHKFIALKSYRLGVPV